MCGTDAATYTRDRPGMSAFVLEDGAVYHTYSAYARGLDGFWGAYQWLDRGPQGAQRDGRLVAPPRRVRQAVSQFECCRLIKLPREVWGSEYFARRADPSTNSRF